MLATVACVACARPHADAASRQEQAAPYLEEFAGYDRWARRVAGADATFSNEAALREAIFAPLHRNPGRIRAAHVERLGADPRQLRYGARRPPPADGWRALSVASLGTVEIRIGSDNEDVWLRRERATQDAARLRVTARFSPSTDSSPSR